jgi:hypothetical protein
MAVLRPCAAFLRWRQLGHLPHRCGEPGRIPDR